MKKLTAKKHSAMLASLVSALCLIFNIIVAPTLSASADEYDLDAPYLGMADVNYTCKFVNNNAEGERVPYNYAMMYEYTEDDVKTFSDLLAANGKGVTALHIRKMDIDGDGKLSVADFVSMYKDVYVEKQGFIVDGQWYPYQLVTPSKLENGDIEIITNILAKIYKPEGGALISNYDYNLNGMIDIGDLVTAKRYRANNPCKYLKDAYGWEIEPEDMSSLLQAADSFGVEHFMIVPVTEAWIPYSIITIGEGFYSGSSYKPYMAKFHAMQILPKTDTVFAENGIEPTYNWGDGASFWRYRYADDDNFEGDLLWITRRFSAESGNSASFALVPIDENGRRLGNLYPSAKDAPLAPEGVTFYNEEIPMG